MLPREPLLQGSRHRAGLEPLLDLADEVLRTWQPGWSPFLSAPLQNEALARFSSLTELRWDREGGYPAAERCRLRCQRSGGEPTEKSSPSLATDVPIHGLSVEGNFLFDPLSPADMHQALEGMGVEEGMLGDIWIRGDRGAQLLCTPEAAALLDGRRGVVRDVEILCESMAPEALQLPALRAVKRLSSVEASCRLDVIASAGFGLSRSKVSQQIRAGKLRLNWEPVRQASRDLQVGDCLQLQDRGSVEVLSLTLTKRDRWRVDMERR
jgi:photosystem II S4 domain protein